MTTSNLTDKIRGRLRDSAYIGSLPSFAPDGFFLAQLLFHDGLKLRYSTGITELDDLTFQLNATRAFKTFVETPIKRISCEAALTDILDCDLKTHIPNDLAARHFFQKTRNTDTGDVNSALFREQMLLLNLFFRERHAFRFGHEVKSLDDVFWIASGIYVFGVPYALAVLSGNSFEREKFDSHEEPAPQLLTELIVQECEDLVFSRLTSGIMDAIRTGCTAKMAVVKPIHAFMWEIPWDKVQGMDHLEEVLSPPSFADNKLTLNWPYFKGLTGSAEEVVLSGRKRFANRLVRLLDDIEALTRATRKVLRSSVIASVASQALSHNIGSHALSDSKLFDPEDLDDRKGLKDFHQYLQGRMDYVAQLISQTPPQPEPMYLFQDVLCDFLRQRLLLNRLVADRGVDGEKITVVIHFLNERGEKTTRSLSWSDDIVPFSKEKDGRTKPLFIDGKDVLVAIPGGSVGRHALYSILENVMRNSVKYGLKRLGSRLTITLALRDPGPTVDYWLLEIWDNFSGFSKDQEGLQYDKLCKHFSQDVIGEDGKARTGGHGLVEIKEAMRFLHSHKDSPVPDDTGAPSPWACEPNAHRNNPNDQDTAQTPLGKNKRHSDLCCSSNLAHIWDSSYGGNEDQGTLVYRIRLQRPRLLAVWCPNAQWPEKSYQSPSEGIFFRNDTNLTAFGSADTPSVSELAPHLLVIQDSTDLNIQVVSNELAHVHWRLPFRTMVLVADEKRMNTWNEGLRHQEANVAQVHTFLGRVASDKGPRGTIDGINFLPQNRVRVICRQGLHEELGSPDRLTLDLALMNKVYDCWIQAYKPLPAGELSHDHRWHLAVCFDRGNEIKHLWRAADAFKADSMTVSAYHYVPVDENADSYDKDCKMGVLHSTGLALTSDASTASRLIHFGNHGNFPKGDSFAMAIRERTVPFTASFGSMEAPRTFNLLYAPPTDREGFKFFALSILEAALTKIAIFDERAISMYLSDDESKHLSLNRVSDAAISGVFPLAEIPSGSTAHAEARQDLTWSPAGQDIPCNKFIYPDPKTGQPSILPQSKTDILILHEGLIEELVSGHTFQSGQDTSFLGQFPQIIRTSGKGRDARKLDQRLAFREYSAISTLMAPYKDGNKKEMIRVEKILLAKAVLNSIGQINLKEPT